MSGRKRDKPYISSSSSTPKRPRPMPRKPESGVNEEETRAPTKQSWLVIVSGLVPSCTVMELKSRFEMFGPISRINIDRALGFGYVTYRSRDSAEAAISSSLGPSSGISLRSITVQVSWPSDPLPQWSAGVRGSSHKDHQPPSKLLRAEIPLSRHGKGKKNLVTGMTTTTSTRSELPFKGREIIAYDDLL
ncbi:homeobox leucine zipper protein [Tasmannia lanceolata]|uniref:homeobox leucine zipper protein n=1 Tax=Tasmannia lanceolata TaxID=3420 RepID=UPI0040642760